MKRRGHSSSRSRSSTTSPQTTLPPAVGRTQTFAGRVPPRFGFWIAAAGLAAADEDTAGVGVAGAGAVGAGVAVAGAGVAVVGARIAVAGPGTAVAGADVAGAGAGANVADVAAGMVGADVDAAGGGAGVAGADVAVLALERGGAGLASDSESGFMILWYTIGTPRQHEETSIRSTQQGRLYEAHSGSTSSIEGARRQIEDGCLLVCVSRTACSPRRVAAYQVLNRVAPSR